MRGAASVVTHLYRGGFSPELWTAERAPGLRSDSRYHQAMEMLASVQPLPHLDLRRTVTRLRRQGVGGGALVIVTGIPDEGALAAYRVLAQDFARTVVLVVADRPGDACSPSSEPGPSPSMHGPGQPLGPGLAHRHGVVMVYRFSWLAGIAGIAVRPAPGSSACCAPRSDGLPWEAILLAAAILGGALTWAGLAYRLRPATIVAPSTSSPCCSPWSAWRCRSTTWFIFPTAGSFPALRTELAYALDVIRTGVAPVLPLAGIVAILAVVFWMMGALLVVGAARRPALRGRAHPAGGLPASSPSWTAGRSGPWTHGVHGGARPRPPRGGRRSAA